MHHQLISKYTQRIPGTKPKADNKILELVYVDIDQAIHKGKSKVARNEKQKKTSVWLDIFIERKPSFSEECILI